jgi:signal transduction histidine kinase
VNTARAFFIESPEPAERRKGEKMRASLKNLFGIVVIINVIAVLLVAGNADTVLPKRV